jgi:hypothetical protein
MFIYDLKNSLWCVYAPSCPMLRLLSYLFLIMLIHYGLNDIWVAVDKEKCRISATHFRIPYGDFIRTQKFACDPLIGVVKQVKLTLTNGEESKEILVNGDEECVFTDGGILNHRKSQFNWIAYLLYNSDVAKHYNTADGAEQHWLSCGQFEHRLHYFAAGNINTNHALRLLLSCNMKDEKNVEEWLRYHFAIGFAQILLFDDYSNASLQHLEKDFPNLIVVRQHSLKHEYMSCAVQYAERNQFNYMIHLDADEYLYVRGNLSLSDTILTAFPKNVSAIYLHWVFFGSCALERNPGKTILNVFTKSQSIANPHVKALVQPHLVDEPVNPHTFAFKVSANLPKRAISNSQGQLIEDEGAIQQIYESDFSKHLLYIAHYHDQSWEDHLVRHVQRYRDDTGQHREYSQEFRQEFDRRFNDIVNLDLANKSQELALST